MGAVRTSGKYRSSEVQIGKGGLAPLLPVHGSAVRKRTRVTRYQACGRKRAGVLSKFLGRREIKSRTSYIRTVPSPEVD